MTPEQIASLTAFDESETKELKEDNRHTPGGGNDDVRLPEPERRVAVYSDLD